MVSTTSFVLYGCSLTYLYSLTNDECGCGDRIRTYIPSLPRKLPVLYSAACASSSYSHGSHTRIPFLTKTVFSKQAILSSLLPRQIFRYGVSGTYPKSAFAVAENWFKPIYSLLINLLTIGSNK